jgi:serine/threonine-protein kinase SRPK3
LIYYLMFRALPVQWFKIDILVASMIDFVGELPPEWQPKWEQLKLDAGGDFELGENGQLSGSRLEQEFNEHVHEPELKGFLPVIKGLTRFLPSDRISASQALDLIRDKCANAQHNEASDDDSDI